MASNGNPATRRVGLSDGWALIRNAKLRDQAEVERIARERGFESSYLDAVEQLRLRIVEWSNGPVTLDAVMELDVEDANKLFRAMRGDEDPNPSAPSSDGGEGEEVSQ